MTTLCFIDTETTGLDARIHQPYEVCFWREDTEAPRTLHLPHTLTFADGGALRIGGYFDRGMEPFLDNGKCRAELLGALRDVTLVGSNPAFDAAMLQGFLGASVWNHRLINVAEGAMWLLGWDRPRGLADVREHLNILHGFDIPQPDHTAEGDVRATRAIYEALRSIQAGGK